MPCCQHFIRHAYGLVNWFCALQNFNFDWRNELAQKSPYAFQDFLVSFFIRKRKEINIPRGETCG
jgi:hypothetical protein